MKKLYWLTLLLLTSCAAEYPMLYMGHSISDRQQVNAANVGLVKGSILSPTQFTRALNYLKRQSNRPIQVVGKDRSVRSFEEYAELMNIPMPMATTTCYLTEGVIVEGMDAKDVWLTKGPPAAIFILDGFITWRYLSDELVVFIDGKTVKMTVSH